MFKEYLPFYKRNLKVAIPVMLSQAGQVLVQQVDNMMVGSVGTVELAAAAFANSVFVLGLVFGMGITFGLTPLVGHAWAKKNNQEAGELLHNSFNTNIIFTVILTLVMWGMSYFFDYMGQTETVVRLSVSYYRILVLSFIQIILDDAKLYLEFESKVSTNSESQSASTSVSLFKRAIYLLFDSLIPTLFA